jgi:hypothetical protein
VRLIHPILISFRNSLFFAPSRVNSTPVDEDGELRSTLSCRSSPALHWPGFWSFPKTAKARTKTGLALLW